MYYISQTHIPKVIYEDEYGKRYQSKVLATCGRPPVSKPSYQPPTNTCTPLTTTNTTKLVHSHHKPKIIHKDQYGTRYQSKALATIGTSSISDNQSLSDSLSKSQSYQRDIDEIVSNFPSSNLSTEFASGESRNQHPISVTQYNREAQKTLLSPQRENQQASHITKPQNWSHFINFRLNCIVCGNEIRLQTKERNRFDCEKCKCSVCYDCCYKTLHHALLFNHPNLFNCPACHQQMSDETAEQVLGKYMWRKCLYFRSKIEYAQDSAALWCPIEGCWQLLAHSNRPKPIEATSIVCHNCGTNVCCSCGQQNHNSISCSCSILQQLHIRDAVWKLLHTRGCPFCQTPIERYGNCTQISCINCDRSFCWTCNKEIQTENINREPHTCKHTDRLENLVREAIKPIGFVSMVLVATLALPVYAPPVALYYASKKHEERVLLGSKMKKRVIDSIEWFYL